MRLAKSRSRLAESEPIPIFVRVPAIIASGRFFSPLAFDDSLISPRRGCRNCDGARMPSPSPYAPPPAPALFFFFPPSPRPSPTPAPAPTASPYLRISVSPSTRRLVTFCRTPFLPPVTTPPLFAGEFSRSWKASPRHRPMPRSSRPPRLTLPTLRRPYATFDSYAQYRTPFFSLSFFFLFYWASGIGALCPEDIHRLRIIISPINHYYGNMSFEINLTKY
jgi:hypothetical protein